GRPAATSTCLLRQIAEAGDARIRAAYVPDTTTGTRWFAGASVWLKDPGAKKDARFLPFTTQEGADAYRAAHPKTRPVSYADAVAESGAR
ncbi:ABC transporter substrate-binding protein, partial [Spongiactinospora gelatinilytica]